VLLVQFEPTFTGNLLTSHLPVIIVSHSRSSQLRTSSSRWLQQDRAILMEASQAKAGLGRDTKPTCRNTALRFLSSYPPRRCTPPTPPRKTRTNSHISPQSMLRSTASIDPSCPSVRENTMPRPVVSLFEIEPTWTFFSGGVSSVKAR